MYPPLQCCLRYFTYTTIFIIILTALLLQGARLSAPYVQYFIPTIESFVSKKTQTQTTIGDIDGYWYGLTPHVILRDISLAQQEGSSSLLSQPSLSPLFIKYVELKVDLLASLFEWEWMWKKIAIHHVNATVVQDESASWSVAGFSMSGEGAEWQYQNPMHILRRMPDVDIKNVALQVMFFSDESAKINIPEIKTEKDSVQGFQRFSAVVNVDDEPTLSIVLEDRPSVLMMEKSKRRQLDNLGSVGFVSITQLPLHLLTKLSLQQSPALLPQWLQSENISHKSFLNGEFWLDFSSPGELRFRANTTAQLDSSSLQSRDDPLIIDMFIHGDLDQDGNASVSLNDVTIRDHEALRSDVVFTKDSQQSLLKIEHIDVGLWSSWIQKRFLLLPKVSDVLTQLSPEGKLSHVYVQFNRDNFSQSIFSANVKGFSVQAFKAVPSAKNVSGYLESSLLSGFVNIDSRDMQFFPEIVYDKTFTFDKVFGQVAWRVDQDKNSLIVNSNVMEGEAVFGEAVGEFLLDIPLGQDSRKSKVTLQLGLKNGDAKYHVDVMPNKVPEDLRTWLAASLRKGHIEQAGFIYRGGFSGSSNTRSFQLFVNASETDLAYSNDWPTLKNVRGQVVVDNEFMQITTTQASVFDEPLKNLSVIWSGDGNQQLHIQTSARLTAATGLRLLTETKLRHGVGSLFRGVNATGDIEADINLLVSPKEQRVADDNVSDSQKIKINFLDNAVSLPLESFPLLSTSSLKGELLYSNDSGLTADSLDMILFGSPLSLNMQTKPQLSSASELTIKGNGLASISTLSSWLRRPEMEFLSGQLPYQFTLTTPFLLDSESAPMNDDASIRVSATSTLQGLAVDFPAPFKKSRSLQRKITLDSVFSSAMTEHNIKMDGGIASKLIITEESISGFLSVGKSFTLPIADNVFVIAADMGEVVLDEWVTSSAKYSAVAANPPSDDRVSEMRFIYDADIDTLSVKDQDFNDFSITGERADGQWRSQFTHALMAGEFTIHDDYSMPVNIAVEYLRLPKVTGSTEQGVEVNDPLANVDLSWVKPAAITVKRLTYGESDLGQWRLMVNPLSEGIQIKDIHATFSGMTLRGETETQGAELFWRTGSTENSVGNSIVNSSDISTDIKNNSPALLGESRFVGQVRGAGIHALFESLDVLPPLTSETTLLSGDFSWSGSPAVFAIGAIRGSLDVELSAGAFIQNTGAGSSGILRLLGLFNFNTWTRRLQLDFSDFYKKGVAYDELSTRFMFDEGSIYFQHPLIVKAPSSEFTMAGTIDYLNEDIDTVLVTTLPVGGNLAFATALVAGLPAAVGVFIFNKVFKSQVDKVSSLTYGIKGDWSEPEVKLINLFDNKLIYDESTGKSTIGITEQGIN
jgi:uncharacterized protein YhdP